MSLRVTIVPHTLVIDKSDSHFVVVLSCQAAANVDACEQQCFSRGCNDFHCLQNCTQECSGKDCDQLLCDASP